MNIKTTEATKTAVKRKNKKIRRILAAALILTVTLTAAFFLYVSDYYHADAKASEAFIQSLAQPADLPAFSQTDTDSIDSVFETERNLTEGIVTYSPKQADPLCGFIFYPGGKVEYTAYEPLAAAFASKGVLCVLVEMPFHLSVLDADAADGIREQFPDVDRWYIGGHSLGGAMASSWLSEQAENFEGLILLGSYSAEDLSDTRLRALSIYGSEDQVLNMEKYDENKSNLPPELTEIVIDGGCHAFFGMYGPQKGDGTPSISNEEQIRQTAEAVAAFVR